MRKGERMWTVVETWACPKCGEIYQSPIEITMVFHTVKEAGKNVRHYMKKVKK